MARKMVGYCLLEAGGIFGSFKKETICLERAWLALCDVGAAGERAVRPHGAGVLVRVSGASGAEEASGAVGWGGVGGVGAEVT